MVNWSCLSNSRNLNPCERVDQAEYNLKFTKKWVSDSIAFQTRISLTDYWFRFPIVTNSDNFCIDSPTDFSWVFQDIQLHYDISEAFVGPGVKVYLPPVTPVTSPLITSNLPPRLLFCRGGHLGDLICKPTLLGLVKSTNPVSILRWGSCPADLTQMSPQTPRLPGQFLPTNSEQPVWELKERIWCLHYDRLKNSLFLNFNQVLPGDKCELPRYLTLVRTPDLVSTRETHLFLGSLKLFKNNLQEF